MPVQDEMTGTETVNEGRDYNQKSRNNDYPKAFQKSLFLEAIFLKYTATGNVAIENMGFQSGDC